MTKHSFLERRKKLVDELKQFPLFTRIMRNEKQHGRKEIREKDNPKS